MGRDVLKCHLGNRVAHTKPWFLGLCKVAEASFWVTVGVKKQLHIPRPRDIVTLMSHSAVWGQGFRGLGS